MTVILIPQPREKELLLFAPGEECEHLVAQ
jgi:hypothetical protein